MMTFINIKHKNIQLTIFHSAFLSVGVDNIHLRLKTDIDTDTNSTLLTILFSN